MKQIKFTSKSEAIGKPEISLIAEIRTSHYINQTSAETANIILNTLKTQGLHHILLRIIKNWLESWTDMFIIRKLSGLRTDLWTV